MDIEEYTEEEFQLVLKRNIRSLIRGKQPSKNPIAILLGGQSGAGKTTIHRIKQKEFQGNIIFIKEIEIVFLIQKKIQFQQQLFYKRCYLGSGIRLKRKC